MAFHPGSSKSYSLRCPCGSLPLQQAHVSGTLLGFQQVQVDDELVVLGRHTARSHLSIVHSRVYNVHLKGACDPQTRGSESCPPPDSIAVEMLFITAMARMKCSTLIIWWKYSCVLIKTMPLSLLGHMLHRKLFW